MKRAVVGVVIASISVICAIGIVKAGECAQQNYYRKYINEVNAEIYLDTPGMGISLSERDDTVRKVDKDVLIKKFREKKKDSFLLADIVKEINVTPDVVDGEWKGYEDEFYPKDFNGEYTAWKCSVCGDVVFDEDAKYYNFCPQCGAKLIKDTRTSKKHTIFQMDREHITVLQRISNW